MKINNDVLYTNVWFKFRILRKLPTIAPKVVCVPQQDFCSLPVVTNGYVYNVTEQGTVTWVFQKCVSTSSSPKGALKIKGFDNKICIYIYIIERERDLYIQK